MLSDQELVERAAAVAIAKAPSVAELSLLRAIAATREEARRHELARQARERAGQLTELGIELLRVVFAVVA